MSATEVDSGFEAGSEPPLCNFKGSNIGAPNETADTKSGEGISPPDIFEDQKVKLMKQNNNNNNNNNNNSNNIINNNKQQQQRQAADLQLNRHECGSNQSGIDSGLGHTSSISSENSSVIANTTSLEQVNARNNAMSINSRPICVSSSSSSGSNGGGNGRQQASGAKSVKVFEDTNSKSDQNKSPLSFRLPISSSTNNELIDRATSNDPEGESSSGKPQVISTEEDEANIKQLAHLKEQSSIQMASPTSRRKEANHEILDPPMRQSGAPHQAVAAAAAVGSLVAKSIAYLDSNTPPRMIKSSLKKVGGKSVGVPKKTKHNRNVSFNQTVIVFCEEIEVSSPSDTFEPPLDYQDSFHSEEMENSLPTKLTDSCAKDIQQQDLYNNDDFDILSKIVCDDASNLTDDQLIGLLENGSLLRNDAISDSESESSPTTDIRLREVPTITSKKAAQISTKPKEPQPQTQPPPPPPPPPPPQSAKAAAKKKESAGCPETSRKDLKNSNDLSSSTLPEDHYRETSAYAAPSVQQKSMPARVKVSTVDNHLRGQFRQSVAQADEMVESLSRDRNVCKPTQSGVMVPSLAKCDALPSKLAAAELMTSTIPQNWESGKTAEETVKRAAKFEQGKDCKQEIVAKTTGSRSLVVSNDQISSRDNRLNGVDQHNQHGPANSPDQPINVANAQILQSNNQGCHICRAIESNINHQTKIGSRGERTSLMTNSNPLQLLYDGASEHQHQVAQKTAQSQYHNSSNVASVEPKQQQHQQMPAQFVPSNQSSCVSCHELTARQRQLQQNYVTQLVRPNLSGRGDQQPPASRSIACQLVYVVDQHGNRMRALQVVNPAQVGLPNGQAPPLLIAHDNCRPQAPATNHMYCAPKPCDQIAASIRQAPPPFASAQGAPNRFVAPSSVDSTSSVMNRQQRMQLFTHSGPKNHTVYYVRQPLGLQNSQYSSGPLTRPIAKSFPDAHEVRRLDGIRAPTESSVSLKEATILTDRPPTLTGASESRPQYTTEERPQRSRKDESEDPSFGFSRRPAVKVVTNTIRESQSQSINLSNSSNPIGPPISKSGSLMGPHTMDRKSANRESRPAVSASFQGNFI